MYEKSYHTKVIKKDPALTKKEKARRRRKRVLYSVLAILAIVLVVVIIKLPFLQIKNITVTGTEVVDPVDIQRFVQQKIEGKYVYIFPKTSVILVPLPKLERELAAAFPRLDTIVLTRTSANTLSILVTEYHAAYLWCVSDVDCDVMDEKGTVYSKAPYFSGVTYLKVFKGNEKDLPFTPLTETDLLLLETIKARFEAMTIQSEAVYFDTPHTVRVVFSHQGTDATLFLDPTQDISKAFDNFYTAIHTEPLGGDFTSDVKKLEYIDLRYGDRVIYKFQ